MDFVEGAKRSERSEIELALAAISRYGDAFQRGIAEFISRNPIKLFIGSVSEVRGSGSVRLEDPENANEFVGSSPLEISDAAGLVRLCVARETILDGGQRGVEGTLVHEGKHALDFAKMLASFSKNGQEPIFNPTAYQREYSAHLTAAFYLLRRGGEYTEEGISLGILQRHDLGVSVNPVGIRRRLERSYGLSRVAQGKNLDTAADPPISLG